MSVLKIVIIALVVGVSCSWCWADESYFVPGESFVPYSEDLMKPSCSSDINISQVVQLSESVYLASILSACEKKIDKKHNYKFFGEWGPCFCGAAHASKKAVQDVKKDVLGFVTHPVISTEQAAKNLFHFFAHLDKNVKLIKQKLEDAYSVYQGLTFEEKQAIRCATYVNVAIYGYALPKATSLAFRGVIKTAKIAGRSIFGKGSLAKTTSVSSASAATTQFDLGQGLTNRAVPDFKLKPGMLIDGEISREQAVNMILMGDESVLLRLERAVELYGKDVVRDAIGNEMQNAILAFEFPKGPARQAVRTAVRNNLLKMEPKVDAVLSSVGTAQ